MLEGVARAVPDLDVDDLAIDLDPRGVDLGDGQIEVWISELAPGGNGHVEQIQKALAEDPSRFVRLLDVVLEDNEYDVLDRDVRRFLDLHDADRAVRLSSDRMREAWTRGHGEASDAFDALRTATGRLDAEFARTAWTTIANRMLGPGAHPDLPATALRLLVEWEVLEAAGGLELPGRVLRAVRGRSRPRRGAPTRRVGRASQKGTCSRELLAPRCRCQSHPVERGQSFRPAPRGGAGDCQAGARAGPRALDITEWNDSEREASDNALQSAGFVLLRFAAGGTGLARRVCLDFRQRQSKLVRSSCIPESWECPVVPGGSS